MRRSLEEVHGSIETQVQAGKLKRFFLFIGPAFMVCVGYMDPGNWATDIAGGSKYGYALIWVLLMSNIIALLLQSLSARLGIVRGLDLAQASRVTYPSWVNIPLYLLAEIAIAATDLAEVLGMAIGLHLLFGLPLIWGVSIAVFDTFIILWLQSRGIRYMEIFIFSLVSIIAMSFLVEMFFAQPDWADLASGFVPSLPGDDALYIAIGIIGATVMPHNLYLHSALVQTRRSDRSSKGIWETIKYNFFDSAIALNLAFFVNAAILVLAAAVFHKHGYFEIVELQDAHALLEPLMGERLAPILFAVALIAAGQSSTVTGTLAGQIVMEGYLDLRIAPWLRRLITRLLAIIPAFLTIWLAGDDKVGELLVLSQVILSLQLGFAIIPLIHFVSNKTTMGEFAIGLPLKFFAWLSASVIVFLNIKLVIETVGEWKESMSGTQGVYHFVILPLLVLAGMLLVTSFIYPLLMKVRDEIHVPHKQAEPLPPIVKPAAPGRVGICVDFSGSDAKAIQSGIGQGTVAETQYYLFHVVESAGARTAGTDVRDLETDADLQRLELYKQQLAEQGYAVSYVLGFGKASVEIVRLCSENNIELLVIGSHGHSGISDFIFGETISDVRHRVKCPVLIV